MTLKSCLVGLLLFLVIGIFVSPVGAFQDAKPAALAEIPGGSTPSASVDVAKPKPQVVAIKSETTAFQIKYLNAEFGRIAEVKKGIAREESDLRKEADAAVTKAAEELGLSLTEYQLDPNNPLQFLLIAKQ